MSNDETKNNAGSGLIAMELEDGTTADFVIDAVYLTQEHQYIALLQVNENGEIADDAIVKICRYTALDNGQAELTDIEDEQELETAQNAYQDLVNEFEE